MKGRLRLTFLGTGTSQGTPVIGCHCPVCESRDTRDNRLRASVLVEVDGLKIVIDTGPDFRQQLLREEIDTIDAVFYTHEHKDHTGGMDDIRALNYTSGRPIDLYCEKRVEQVLRKDYDYAFSVPRYPGAPEVKIHTITENPFWIDNTEIIPVRGMHHNLPVLGFRIGDLCYLTDMNQIPDQEFAKFEGVEVLIINALREEEHLSHFALCEAVSIARRANVVETYLTHVSHQMGRYKKVLSKLPGNVYLAYDGLQIEL